jgi:5'-nucleotidase
MLVLTLVVASLTISVLGGAEETTWPKRVLITNDDGIDDIGIAALARAFSKVSETIVIAPLEDRSGSGNCTSLGPRKYLAELETRDLGQGVVAYGLDGFPADCVYFALQGLLREDPPDLVISGINGGPNLGPDWFGSATVGAARVAAFVGVPALAVSGIFSGDPGAVNAAAEWIVRLAQSPVARRLEPGQYLTVSIPRIPPSEIRGVKIAARAGLDATGYFRFIPSGDSVVAGAGREVWQMTPPQDSYSRLEGDVVAYAENFIVIVPMRVDETDRNAIKRLLGATGNIPPWTP